MKVLIANAAGPVEDYQRLVAAGCELTFGRPWGSHEPKLTPDEALPLCEGVECYVSTDGPKAIIDGASDLVAVISNAIGYDRIDVEAATARGILVCNSVSPENAIGVAESTVGLMIALAKRMKRKERLLREQGWGSRKDRGTLLSGKTVGIVGLGRIGRGVAERLATWDVRLIAYAPSASPETVERSGATLVDLPDLLRDADFVTLHVNAKPANHHMIGEAELRSMRPTAHLVNMARGAVVDSAALCRAIEEDWIAGAALDVFESEPLAMDDPLRELDPDRVILTPHALSASVESRMGNLDAVIDNVLCVMRGEAPATTVNPEVLSTWRGRARA